MDLVAFLYGALACITTERARIAAQDTASASLTVMCTHPALYRAVTSAQHQALAMRKEAHYAGDLVALSDSATADTHEALSDDAEIYDAIAQEQRDAHEHDAHLSTRDDGALYHGRLPHEDSDPFTPWVILPPPSHAALYVQRMGIATLATLATSHHKVTCPACGAPCAWPVSRRTSAARSSRSADAPSRASPTPPGEPWRWNPTSHP